MHSEDSSPCIPFAPRSIPRSSSALRSEDPLVALMLRYLGGELDVFSALYRALAPHVRRQVHAILGGDPMADDLVQDTFLKAHAARGRFDPSRLRGAEGVIAWFCAIARNAAVSELRRRYSGSRVSAEPGPEPEHLPCDAPDAERWALWLERRHRAHALVHRSLAHLPPSQRQVVELHKLRGLTMREVAQRLGIRPVTARVRAHRAYRAMADRLDGSDLD